MKGFKEWFVEKHQSQDWAFWWGDEGELHDDAYARVIDSIAEYIDEVLEEKGL